MLADAQADSVRIATFNAANAANADLSRDAPGALFEELSAPGSEDATEVARVIQTVRPDVLVLTGIDVDAGDNLAKAFNANYLAVGGDDHTGITYPYRYTAPSNAGVESGADLDRNGTIGGPGDALGYGDFPGQSSMIVYSTYPMDTDNIRDFSALPWKSMPDNAEADADYILDHRGDRGPLDDDAAFVIAGSLKADPQGEPLAGATAISSLLDSEVVIDPQPARTLASSAMGGAVLPN